MDFGDYKKCTNNHKENLCVEIREFTLSSKGPKSLWMLFRRRCKIMTVARSFMLVTSSTLSRRLDFSVIHSYTRKRNWHYTGNITFNVYRTRVKNNVAPLFKQNQFCIDINFMYFVLNDEIGTVTLCSMYLGLGNISMELLESERFV